MCILCVKYKQGEEDNPVYQLKRCSTYLYSYPASRICVGACSPCLYIVQTQVRICTVAFKIALREVSVSRPSRAPLEVQDDLAGVAWGIITWKYVRTFLRTGDFFFRMKLYFETSEFTLLFCRGLCRQDVRKSCAYAARPSFPRRFAFFLLHYNTHVTSCRQFHVCRSY